MAKSATPKPLRPKVAADLSLLSDEDKTRLKKEAKLKVDAERKLDAEEAYLAQITLEHQRDTGVEEPLVDVVLELPLFADRLVLDGIHYMNNIQYAVPQGRYDVMVEQQQRMWNHQNEIDGKRGDPRRPLNRVMTRHGAITTSNLQRV